MQLKDQVCSLDLSKRLKELGVKPDSLFYWLRMAHKNHYSISYLAKSFKDKDSLVKEICSAFTVAELGKILPKGIPNKKIKWKEVFLRCEPANKLGNWLISYGNDILVEENTEANARAKMLIYLIENKLLEVKDDL